MEANIIFEDVTFESNTTTGVGPAGCLYFKHDNSYNEDTQEYVVIVELKNLVFESNKLDNMQNSIYGACINSGPDNTQLKEDKARVKVTS